SERKLTEGCEIVDSELTRFRCVVLEALGFEILRLHRDYKSSGIRLPCASEGENPRIPPMVGTKSVDPSGRSETTPSRTPAPMAINEGVRDSGPPGRWCWKPLPPASSSESRPKSGRMNIVVLPAYSGSLWIACHVSRHNRSVRRMPSM